MTTAAAAHRGIQAPTGPALVPVTVPGPATVVAAGCAYADPVWDLTSLSGRPTAR